VLDAPPPIPPAPPAPPPSLRLSASVPAVRDTSSTPAVSLQELLLPNRTDSRPAPPKKKKKRCKKILVTLVLLGMTGGAGYYFRNAAPIQRLLGKEPPAAPLPDVPFVRQRLTSAEYVVTLSAVQNGVPNNVTTSVLADFTAQTGQSTIESQMGGVFTTTQEIRDRDSIYRPGLALGAQWTRQPRVPETPSPYDVETFIPMVDQIVDQPLRNAMEPTSSKTTEIDGLTVTSLTYVIDRAKVPEIAPAIFARVPWLFDVPNATNLTVEISYDESGLVRHLFFAVDPPQAGTGVGATWVTSYTLDVVSVNAPVEIVVPVEALNVPAGTP
jgi:hypothetical protein